VYCLNCIKFRELIKWEYIKYVATRCHILKAKIDQIRFWLTLPQILLGKLRALNSKSCTSKGREKRKKGGENTEGYEKGTKKREGEKKIREKGTGKKGKGERKGTEGGHSSCGEGCLLHSKENRFFGRFQKGFWLSRRENPKVGFVGNP